MEVKNGWFGLETTEKATMTMTQKTLWKNPKVTPEIDNQKPNPHFSIPLSYFFSPIPLYSR